MPNVRLGIIGAGAMGSAIARGLVRTDIFKADEIVLIDKFQEKLDELSSEGFKTHADIQTLKDYELETIIIAVKPKDISELLETIKEVSSNDKVLIISIAAGVKIASLSKVLANPIVRVMPNTPCQIGRGASVLSTSEKVGTKELDRALSIFEALGTTLVMDESKLDAVTALSGSGPAYIFYLIEAMIEAGIKLGLTESEAEKLAIATSSGAGQLVQQEFSKAIAQDPANAFNTVTQAAQKLRTKVTSPNGTTSAAIQSLEQNGFKDIIATALKAAYERSIELG